VMSFYGPPTPEDDTQRLWVKLGTRQGFSSIISQVTRIPKAVLEYPKSYLSRDVGKPWEHYSVAQKMSWAANRECTRVEDLAYCLLGLFGINMPLLYGEREHAFFRLQVEIFNSTDDHSLLAWSIPKHGYGMERELGPWTITSVFAPTAKYFEHCGNISRLHDELDESSSLTKKGVRISIPVEAESESPSWNLARKYSPVPTYRVALNCSWGEESHLGSGFLPSRISLLLIKAVEKQTIRQPSRSFPCSYNRLLAPGHLLAAPERSTGSSNDELASNPRFDPFQIIFLPVRMHHVAKQEFEQRVVAEEPINFYVDGLPWAIPLVPSYAAPPPSMDSFRASGRNTFGYEIVDHSYFTFDTVYPRIFNLDPVASYLYPKVFTSRVYMDEASSSRLSRKDNGLVIRGGHPIPVWKSADMGMISSFSLTGHTLFRVKVKKKGSSPPEGFSILCTITRPYKGARASYELEVRPDGVNLTRSRIFGYANVEDINGSTADIDCELISDLIVSVELLSTQSWVHPRGTVPEGLGYHLHLKLSIRFRRASDWDHKAHREMQLWGLDTQEPWADALGLMSNKAAEVFKAAKLEQERARMPVSVPLGPLPYYYDAKTQPPPYRYAQPPRA